MEHNIKSRKKAVQYGGGTITLGFGATSTYIAAF